MDTAGRKRKTKRLLVHYFKASMQAAGLNFDNDNQVEIEEIADLIFDEITEQCAAVDERRERLAQPLALDAPERSRPGHRARLFKGKGFGPDWGATE